MTLKYLAFVNLCIGFILIQPSKSQCPNGWNHYDSSCYRMSHDSETWLDAMDVCKLDNAYLVEINTARENNFVKSVIAARNVAAWTGGTDIMVDGQWVWIHSTQNISYFNWASRQPDNANKNENCMTIGASGQWNDIACTALLEYMCELPMGDPGEIIG